MKATKTFDCVAMKDAIQAKLCKRRRGMTDEEIREDIERRLETSEDPVAQLWRKLKEREATTLRK